MKKWIPIIGSIILIGLVLGRDIPIHGTKDASKIVDHHVFIDDVGNKIMIHKIPSRIVSLSTVHTENIYALEASHHLIGVDKGSHYPARVVDLPRYAMDHEADMDKLIKAKPDLVLITPEINQQYPRVVSKLESNGLWVVSLMPKSVQHFDYYIQKLAMLIQKEDQANRMLKDYHAELNQIKQITSQIKKKKTVFVETSQKGFWTPAQGSLLFEAIDLAGGINIVKDAKPSIPNQPQVRYGFSHIERNQEVIDVYFTLQGVRDGGGSIISINQQDKFRQVKAIREGEVYELLHPLVNQYTFRYVKGVRDMARILYPEVMIDETKVSNDIPLTREVFSHIVYNQRRLQMFTITGSDYYDVKKHLHTYGKYLDVTEQDADFDQIETVSMRGYLLPKRDKTGNETFGRHDAVTRSDIAHFIYIIKDLTGQKDFKTIKDIKGHNQELMINKVVAHGEMQLMDGYFKPDDPYTVEALYSLLERLRDF
ncbi:ABC transporter substrate-binding protein [Vallitalea pronyensis]|uniref:ABC transporter substrate-binding protein n=1 Tax=Vallitalea pronyensis TaxID=1348613 RepID=A0A8J8MH93_9FIRM|nr:ABC transporter substrate-binding protein [Vallitalea pronyensis]QUI21782.1 ABC transporter substrate-binding protein [Vallitalea pronyensis]